MSAEKRHSLNSENLLKTEECSCMAEARLSGKAERSFKHSRMMVVGSKHNADHRAVMRTVTPNMALLLRSPAAPYLPAVTSSIGDGAAGFVPLRVTSTGMFQTGLTLPNSPWRPLPPSVLGWNFLFCPEERNGMKTKQEEEKTHDSAPQYQYPINTDLDYPQTSEMGVGHLFQLQPGTVWGNPTSSFAYSLGSPKGYSLPGREVDVDFFGNGFNVRCRVKHSTCQGSKICPKSDLDLMSEPHSAASRSKLQARLCFDRQTRIEGTSPSRNILKKTAALVTALRRLGCTAALDEITVFDAAEQAEMTEMLSHRAQNRRGYSPSEETCDGRLQLEYDYHTDRPSIRQVHRLYMLGYLMFPPSCEHYSSESKDHLVFTAIADGSYDMGYLDALFSNDTDEIKLIEDAAFTLGFGPLVECSTVCNVSVQKTLCPFDHRDAQDILIQHQMIRLECKCTFRIYEPLEEYQDDFPYLLVVSKGVHSHPIPLPSKTPPRIRGEILDLLPRFQEDFPDLTPRRFLRHLIVKAHLALRFPQIQNPTLSDLHISLANRSHLKMYIDQVRTKLYPAGTGWKGILHLNEVQSISRPLKDHYIRRMVDIDADGFESHEEDDPIALSESRRLRFIVCMTVEGSERLLKAQYVQSDIGFRRVVGFYEFELGAWERDPTTSVAHLKIFQAIEEIVHTDTGKRLRWRHIHGNDLEDFNNCLLQWMGDQHGGQAKGLGLHLQSVAQNDAQRADLHDPTRTFGSLAPYEHLHRSFILIGMGLSKRSGTWEEKREMIGSMIKSEAIRFPSHVLGEKFNAESRLGIQCTILGGIMKGEFYDTLQMKTLRVFEETGVRTSYSTGHPSENAVKNLKRKSTPQSTYIRKDLQPRTYRSGTRTRKIQQAHEKIRPAKDRIANATLSLARTHSAHHPARHATQTLALERANRALEKARKTWQKEVEQSEALVAAKRGTGRVCLVFSSAEMM
ncbi:hypothetical protein DFH09DRAFT_1070271 [Mycena vulgaris]|nr:hypothetical protein DFH09DRAFT_1070271 [Mycena vulgaris]